MRKRVTSKNWIDKNGQSGEKWASGGRNEKRAGNIQDDVEAVTGRITGVKSC